MPPPSDPTVDRTSLEALLESSVDAMYLIEPQGRIRLWTWGAEQMYGFAKSEAVGRSIFELTVPFDRRDELVRLVKEAQETGSGIVDTLRRRKDGSPLNVQVMVKTVPLSPGPMLLSVSEKDVTEQKRFEQTLMEQVWSLTGVQTFLQSILDGTKDYSILAVDLDGKIQEWNAGATRDFGYPPDEVKGQNCRPLLVTADDPGADRSALAFDTALKEGRFEGEFDAVRRDGSHFPARTTINLRRGPYDDPIGFVLILKDVTEEKRAEKERRLAQERLVEIQTLEEVSRLKTQLLNTASHELNTPLTPIRLQVHMLASGMLGALDQRQSQAVDVLARNVTRLADVVQQILDVARQQADQAPLMRTDNDVVALVRGTVDALKPEAAAGGIHVRLESRTPVHASLDADQIAKVMQSLLQNAIKFTPRGGRVAITVARENGAALLHVQDSGVGIPPERLANLFAPFSQAHDTMERTRSGAGLSLFLAKGIVEAHGGRIWAESEGTGKGSLFAVRLPIQNA